MKRKPTIAGLQREVENLRRELLEQGMDTDLIKARKNDAEKELSSVKEQLRLMETTLSELMQTNASMKGYLNALLDDKYPERLKETVPEREQVRSDILYPGEADKLTTRRWWHK